MESVVVIVLFISAARPTRNGLERIENKVRHSIFIILEAVKHAPTHTRRSYWRRR